MPRNWRISPEHPVRDLQGKLDYERCATLHNEIMERAWVGAGHDLNDLPRTTYWDRWHSDPNMDVDRLYPEVIKFFKLALTGYDERVVAMRRHGNFFRFVCAFWGPEPMFSVANLDQFYKQRYLALYPVALPYISHHGSGVMYDQVTARAIFQQDMDDGESTMVGRSLHLLSPGEQEGPKLSGRLEWLPLEQILDSYLDMIDQGKVVAVSTEPEPDTDDGDCQEWVDPWIMPSYTEDDLRATLTQFQRLVEAIESRMPPDSLVNLDIQFGCLDLGDEDGQGEESPEESIPVLRPNEFARHFLAAACRPRFEFIAPGLSWVVAGPQPFEDADYIGDLDQYMRPVLLARGDGDAVDLPDGLDEFEDIPDNLPCGLYLTELNKIDRAPFEDGCRLVLPYTLGINQYGRRSDGTFFGEGERPRMPPPLNRAYGSSNDIFQQGYNPFIVCHDVQLRHVLQRWAELVEAGHWEVDERGVVGGIDKWREADEEAHWQKYQLPSHW